MPVLVHRNSCGLHLFLSMLQLSLAQVGIEDICCSRIQNNHHLSEENVLFRQSLYDTAQKWRRIPETQFLGPLYINCNTRAELQCHLFHKPLQAQPHPYIKIYSPLFGALVIHNTRLQTLPRCILTSHSFGRPYCSILYDQLTWWLLEIELNAPAKMHDEIKKTEMEV